MRSDDRATSAQVRISRGFYFVCTCALGAMLLLVVACSASVRVGDVVAANDAADAGTAVDSSEPDTSIAVVDASVDATGAVANVAGLTMWLDGDRGVNRLSDGGLLWSDQSGHGNVAIAPRAVPPSTTVGFAGHSALAFNSTQLLTVADAPSLQCAADFTVIVVARSTTPSSEYGALLGKSAKPYPFPGQAMFVNYPPLSGAPTSTVGAQLDFTTFVESSDMGVSDGIARVYEMQRTGTLLSIRVNSGARVSATVPVVDVRSVGAFIYIGGNLAASVVQGLTGAIAEVLFVNGTVADADYITMHTYLTAKYAIP